MSRAFIPPPVFAHVEITSPGTTPEGRRLFLVDFVEADECRCGLWDGNDYGDAILAAGDCAVTDAGKLPVIDRVGESEPF